MILLTDSDFRNDAFGERIIEFANCQWIHGL
jgi:hypothetical protein